MRRPKVPAAMKRQLLAEAGDRCANPGCPNGLTEFHHIEEWAVYQRHVTEEMIAICPACHDAVDRGDLTLDDDVLRLWKTLQKAPRQTDILYTEPSDNPMLRLGPVGVTGQSGVIVFSPTDGLHLSFRLEGGDLGLVNASVLDKNGAQLITVSDNRVRYRPLDLNYRYARRPGRFEFSGPAEALLADWMIESARTVDPTFGTEPEMILSAEVTGLGEVTVCGIWTHANRALIAQPSRWIVPQTSDGAMQVNGSGTLIWAGPVDQSFFEHGFKGIF